MGKIIMFSSFSSVLIAAMVGLSMQQGAPDSGRTSHVAADPELYDLLPADQFDAGALHKRLEAEPRIAEWAARSEAALRATYSIISNLGDAGLKAQCGATLCEVTSPLPTEKETSKGEIDALYRSLQAPELAAKLANIGLVHQGSLFTSTKTASPRPIFVSFWRRKSDRHANDDQLDGVLPKEERGHRARYTRLREEVRDPLWFAQTESGLRHLIDKLDVVHSQVKINCAATLCEVAILSPPGTSNPQTEAFYDRLQSPAFERGLERLGLKGLEASFSGLPQKPSRTLYVSYLSRTRT